jgi:hypothetical protein
MAACKKWGTGVAAVTSRELCFDLHRRLGTTDTQPEGSRRFGSSQSFRCGASAIGAEPRLRMCAALHGGGG